jgi:ubiquinone/menaquinone biosynthesis C-methylase UbiE
MSTARDEQTKRWNSAPGHAWVEMQAVLDQTFAPLETLLVDAVAAASPARVLDIGCGTGATTLAVARRIAANDGCVGVDISEPMIAAARARAERERLHVTFICANAQEHAFDPARVDMLISRFGVMFFDDPVRAFANLRRASRRGAALRCIVWRSAAENPFMTTAERAAAPLLPDLPARKPDAPGQFAFANAERVRDILKESGWTEIDIQPLDVVCMFPEKELVPYLTRLGPVGLALQDAGDDTRARVVETIRPAFDPFVHAADVRFVAACWMIGARG